MREKINPNYAYRPMEIVKKGWIKNTESKPDYKYVLKLIKDGELKATNVCTKKGKVYWRVQGKDLIEFLGINDLN